MPIRDEQGQPLPGIRLEDNGEKLGLNGVDNGRIWFDHVRVPRVEMLDRFAQVAADGSYASSIKNPAARFFTTLGTLVGGRVCVGHSGLSIAKSGLAIAVRYGARRRQFGPAEGQPETILLDYPAHQRRLMPLAGECVRAGLRVQASDQARADHRAGRFPAAWKRRRRR